MIIRKLKQSELPEIVDCLVASFADYFVPMPADVTYWQNRFAGARVNYDLSYGAFEQDKLAGFIMQGIDSREGVRTAFNTGTGVLPAYRGQQIVDQLYAFALPELKVAGVKSCALEVIQKNEKAIRVYERIGFSISRKYHCFKGTLMPFTEEFILDKVAFEKIAATHNPQHTLYAWDNCNSAIRASKGVYQSYHLKDKATKSIGFFVMNPATGYLAQLEVNNPSVKEDWKKLFAGIASVNTTLKINNIDHRRKELISLLPELGLENHVDQYEMEMSVK